MHFWAIFAFCTMPIYQRFKKKREFCDFVNWLYVTYRGESFALSSWQKGQCDLCIGETSFGPCVRLRRGCQSQEAAQV